MASPNDIDTMQRPAGNNVAEEATKPAPTEHVSFSADSIKSVVHEQLDSASNLTAAARHNIFKAGTAVWTTVKQPLTEVVQMIRNANSPATGTPLRKSIADVRVAASNTLVSVETTVKDAETSLEKNLVPVKEAMAVVQDSSSRLLSC
ncbi:hypothetical protein, variant [Aphanomyces invadans]|uniref:Uncharacterized protein n=1 Tax=Aphanomyces invadans TaxID=157072 RepID=A0A024TF54_9STRA|nr:hypothetical protein, variant [Aphanomyces invadans]ETV92644.1 hypothetical protein, variant [Aphanomyces invadans]|eukprot:XP_008878679.1 hypothetical protein, variant [Aphanomyces invadans]